MKKENHHEYFELDLESKFKIFENFQKRWIEWKSIDKIVTGENDSPIVITIKDNKVLCQCKNEIGEIISSKEYNTLLECAEKEYIEDEYSITSRYRIV